MKDDDIQVPEQRPESGFYYHYKHDPSGPENTMAYEMMGVGWHTETGEFTVQYRPLYEEAWAYTAGKLTYVRPLTMFMDIVEKPEYHGPRFIQIIDPSLIERLEARKKELYG